jgi:hypothetical protein
MDARSGILVDPVETLFTPANRLELSASQRQVDKLTPSLLARPSRGDLVPQTRTTNRLRNC